jgi:hypothetical protein
MVWAKILGMKFQMKIQKIERLEKREKRKEIRSIVLAYKRL